MMVLFNQIVTHLKLESRNYEYPIIVCAWFLPFYKLRPFHRNCVTLGIILLVPTENFSKNEHFLPL